MHFNLKENILAALMLAENQYCSGRQLAEQFGVSRTAIWKVIDQLKEQGCFIDAATNKGYILREIPDIYSQLYMEELTKDLDANIYYYDEIDSTNRLAKELAGKNAPSGTVILAGKQTNGRGRLGKTFHSPEGGLYMSVIIRLNSSLTAMMRITACTAVAVHEALQEFGVTAKIKWVNDLFLHQKKICGILSEGSFHAELLKMEYSVIGIGINLHPDEHLPEELKPLVTDIETETGKKINRCQLAAAILHHLKHDLLNISQKTYLNTYTAYSCTLGHRVRMDNGTEGLALRFTDEAGLILRKDDGTEMCFTTGSAQILN